LTELGEHRKASIAIFELFNSIVESNGDIEELLDMIDVSKLTSFEIKTFAVASRPFVTCTKLYCMATNLNKKLLEVKLELVDVKSELDKKRRELADLKYEYTLFKSIR
jgi:hypothetical protein